MPMIDLKRTPREVTEATDAKWEAPEYSYGLRLTFDEDTLSKLGLSAKDFTVGQVLDMKIQTKVSEVSMEATGDSETQRVSLTVVAVDKPGSTDESKAERLFGGKSE